LSIADSKPGRTRESGFDAKEFVKRMGPDYLVLGRTSDGDPALYLPDLPWADRWMSHYDLEVPHHRHWQKLK